MKGSSVNMVQRDEYRQMVLAGTVSFPATFPQLGKLSLKYEKLPFPDRPSILFLSVTESPSARVTLERRVRADAVRAVFVPRDPGNVSYSDGEWLIGDEVLSDLERLLSANPRLEGIAYVAESEPSLLNVSVGMTAGESVQYYPPLPNDPAYNHYNAWPQNNAVRSKSCEPASPELDVSQQPVEEVPTVSRGINPYALWSCNG